MIGSVSYVGISISLGGIDVTGVRKIRLNVVQTPDNEKKKI